MKRRYYILVGCFIAIFLIFYFKNDNYTTLKNFKNNKKFEVKELLAIHNPYKYGDKEYLPLMQNRKGDFYIITSKEIYCIHTDLTVSIVKNKEDLKFKQPYYSKFISNEYDEDYVKRNKIYNLNPKAKKITVKVKKEPISSHFRRNIKNPFNYNPFNSKSSRKRATYYIKIPTKKGSFKFKTGGDVSRANATVFFSKDNEEYGVMFIEENNKIFGVKVKN